MRVVPTLLGAAVTASATTTPRECLCSIRAEDDGTQHVGCGAYGYGGKWCYVQGPNCSQSWTVEKDEGGRRLCSGYRCRPFYALPQLQLLGLDVNVYDHSPGGEPVGDWPDCCALCSKEKTCVAWQFVIFDDGHLLGNSPGAHHRCELFLLEKDLSMTANSIVEQLLKTAEPFPNIVGFLPSYIYGLPGYDDTPRQCIGRRENIATELQGVCFSYLAIPHIASPVLLLIFACMCWPWACKWVRFARVVRGRGFVATVLARPGRVRHEWDWDESNRVNRESDRVDHGIKHGTYHAYKVFEVDFTWEYPDGQKRTTTYISSSETKLPDGQRIDLQTPVQTKRLFNALTPPADPLEVWCALPMPAVVPEPEALYKVGACSPELELTPGCWHVETPSASRNVPLVGLVDPKRPELILPVQSEDGSPDDIARPVYGAGFCICGCLAAIPSFIAFAVKLYDPLVEEAYMPAAWQGYDSSSTKSRFHVLSRGRWDLDTTRAAAMIGVSASLAFMCCCAFPWWLVYVRSVLRAIPRVALEESSSDSTGSSASETTRLLRQPLTPSDE